MKFKIDENLPDEGAARFRSAGHACDTVAEEGLRGSTDRAISAVLQREGRIIVTLDVGFSNIQAYAPEQFAGIVVL